ncbi:Asp23/Gls24 family envelope stress response protein [Streptomyces agglomeratus]|uniref:Asp23/Gls24 family envelope stress response protein n=1 Tax=Streptomyces agglomeratus TaxID=285458 RepID=UPI000D1B3D03|nr:Asp23/Gls24 family envelope stress response protein [Streptomyces agglomeratus]
MPHRNAPLTETGRLRLARCVVEDGWPLRRAAERFQVSPTTAQRWADRYRTHGEAGMRDLSSRPHTSPRRTPTRTERRIIKVRILRRWGPARIAGLLHLVPSVSGMHAMGGGFARGMGAVRDMAPGGGHANVTRGVKVEGGERQAAVDLALVVEYGVAITDVAGYVREDVIQAVERMAGLEVVGVNIDVNDVHLPGDEENESAEGRAR